VQEQRAGELTEIQQQERTTGTMMELIASTNQISEDTNQTLTLHRSECQRLWVEENETASKIWRPQSKHDFFLLGPHRRARHGGPVTAELNTERHTAAAKIAGRK
jgi:hypothetical protein